MTFNARLGLGPHPYDGVSQLFLTLTCGTSGISRELFCQHLALLISSIESAFVCVEQMVTCRSH